MRVTTTLCHAEAQLLKRNEKLEELWALDKTLRQYHGNDAWKADTAARVRMHDWAEHRQNLSDEITQMGAVPWCFNIARDNSWLAGPRGG